MRRSSSLVLFVAFAVTLLLTGSVSSTPRTSALAVDNIDCGIQRFIGQVKQQADDVDEFVGRLDERLKAAKKSNRKETQKESEERRVLVKQLVRATERMTTQFRAGQKAVVEYKQKRLRGRDAEQRKRTLQRWSKLGKRFKQTRQRATAARRKYSE